MDQIEQKILSIIDQRAQELIERGKALYCRAEQGFSEYETAKMTAEVLRALGLEPREGLAVTGLRAMIGKESGPTVALIGELDGIKCPEHPQAVAETGMSHSCGHHGQMMAMLGAAYALSDAQVAASLDGRAAIFAVPAEEYLAADIREGLQKSGAIRYSCGKSELIRLGEFDDVDIALTTHAHMVAGVDCDILLGNNSASGFIGKTALFQGKAAHAAMCPHEGVNALNAASLALSALGMLRETFQEKDYIRVHPVMRGGGGAINVVPDEAVLDMMVRAKSLEAIEEASAKVDRAFRGAAEALGARVSITNAQGYMPVIERDADKVLREAAALLGDDISIGTIRRGVQNTASTDVGDLTHIMPVLNFTFGGCKGALHSKDFMLTDEYRFFVAPAKLLALTAYRLLRKGAVEAKKLMQDFTPVYSRKGYIDKIEEMYFPR